MLVSIQYFILGSRNLLSSIADVAASLNCFESIFIDRKYVCIYNEKNGKRQYIYIFNPKRRSFIIVRKNVPLVKDNAIATMSLKGVEVLVLTCQNV